MKAKKKRSLRSLLLEPFKQIKFGLYMIGISVIFIVLIAGLFVQSFADQYQQLMSIFKIIDPHLQWETITNDVFFINAVRIGMCLILYLGLMFFAVFKLTHRYYGPLVSIERFVDEISSGNYSARVVIRKNDELHDLVEKLNHMAAQLDRKK